MKLMIINPDYGMIAEEMDNRCQILKRYVGQDTALSMRCLTESQIELDSALDAVLAGPEIVSLAVQAEAEGYDGIVLYCFSDPAADACREAVSIPVVGGAQAACLIAPLVARQAGVLLADGARIPEKKLFLSTLGLQPEWIAAIEAIDFRGRSIWEEREEALRQLEHISRRMMETHSVQALILGCLSFLGLAGPLSKRLGIPVIDPAIAAVSLAESLVRQELHTSRLAWPAPPRRKRTWAAGEMD